MRKITKMIAVIVCSVFMFTTMGQTILAADNTTKVLHVDGERQTGVKAWLTKAIVKALSKTLRSATLRKKVIKWVEVQAGADVAVMLGKNANVIADFLDTIQYYADVARNEMAQRLSDVLMNEGIASDMANKIGWAVVWVIDNLVF